MHHVQVTYRIRPERLTEAEKRITEFVTALRGGKRLYESYRIFRQPADRSNYLHLISFPGHEAQLEHTQLPHVKSFVEKMVGLCESGPVYTELESQLQID